MYKEGRDMQKMAHPHIAQVYHVSWEYDVDQDKFSFMHLMEYIDGQTLKEKNDKQKLTISEILNYTKQICDALGHAHQHGIIHRDIKPDNIMITRAGQVKVIDFGIAKTQEIDPEEIEKLIKLGIDIPEDKEAVIIGTPKYMSPEQANSRHDLICPASDVYALGATLYRLLAGRDYIRGENLFNVVTQLLCEEATSPATVNPDIPKELGDLVKKMMSKDIGRRPQSMAEVKRIIETIEKKIAPEERLAAA
jgi:serine/threonine-protein kinase